METMDAMSPLIEGGKSKRKRKVKMYKDRKSYFINDPNGKKIRFKSKLGANELIKFLVMYLKPRRKHKGTTKEKKTSVSDIAIARSLASNDSKMTALVDQNRQLNAIFSKENVSKEIPNLKNMSKQEKLKFIQENEDLKEVVDTIKDGFNSLTNEAETHKKQRKALLEAKRAELLKKRDDEIDKRIREIDIHDMRRQYRTTVPKNTASLKPQRITRASKNELIPELREMGAFDFIIDELKNADQTDFNHIADELRQLDGVVDEGKGRGKSDKNAGTTDRELNHLMRNHPEFLGCISADEVSKILPYISRRGRHCFIINTDPSHKDGEHWQAVYADARPSGSNSIEFYDSYGDEPSKKLMADLNRINIKLRAVKPIQVKINRIRHQNDKSSNCGEFCCKFLIDRLNGVPFSKATGFDDSAKREKDIEKWKRKYKKFKYLKGRGIGDVVNEVKDRIDGFLTAQRGNASPAFRNMMSKLHAVPIKAITIFRKPLTGIIQKLANWFSLGKYQENIKRMDYDDVYHLGMIILLESGVLLKLDKSEVVNLVQLKTMDKGIQMEQVPANIMPKGLVLGDMLTNGIKEAGSVEKYFDYDPINNNCQYFVKYCLKGNGMWNSTIEKFVWQDPKEILRGMDGLAKEAQGITDFAGRLDILLNGR